jgi:hypothetical protein
MREEDIAFHLLAVVDHHIDDVAALNRDLASRRLELFDRDDAFGLISEIDDHIFGGDAKDGTLHYFIGGWRGKLTIIFEQMLVVFGDRRVHLPVVLVYGHSASASY